MVPVVVHEPAGDAAGVALGADDADAPGLALADGDPVAHPLTANSMAPPARAARKR
jgi:hypothetical protein